MITSHLSEHYIVCGNVLNSLKLSFDKIIISLSNE